VAQILLTRTREIFVEAICQGSGGNQQMPRIDEGGGGGGDTVVIDAGELRGLASTARGDVVDINGIKSTVSGLIGGMDRRGWNAGAADGAWSAARGTLSNLSTALETTYLAGSNAGQRRSPYARRSTLTTAPTL
jgi:hypothetical protein